MCAMAKKKSPHKVGAPPYTVSLKLGDTLLEGSGTTVLQALRAIQKPVKITTKSILTVTQGDKTHSRGMTIPRAKRLFYPAAQIYIAEDLQLLLK